MLYALLAFVGGAIWSYYLQNVFTQTTNIDKLKNALLTLSLIKLKDKDFSTSIYYKNYDGTKLPPLSGNDLTRACFTYIFDIHEFRNSNIYSSLAENKLKAIHKYLNTNFASEHDVMEYFKEVLERVK